MVLATPSTSLRMQLPGNPTENRLSGYPHSWMGIADDDLHASLHQALQEGRPVDFLRAERYGKPQYLAFSVEGNPAYGQKGRISDLSIHSHFLIASIQIQIADHIPEEVDLEYVKFMVDVAKEYGQYE